MQKERMLWPEIARGICAIAIIFSHVGIESRFLSLFYQIEVVMFFFLSGYLEKDGKGSREKIKNKCCKLIVPYFIYSLVLLLLNILLWFFDHTLTWDNVFLAVIGIFYSRAGIIYPYYSSNQIFPLIISNGALWFLPAMFCGYCLSLVYYKCKEKPFVYGGGYVISLLLAARLFHMIPYLLPWSIDTAPYIALIMIAGNMYANIQKKELTEWGKIVLLCISMVLYYFLIKDGGQFNLSVRIYGDGDCALVNSLICNILGCFILMELARYMQRVKAFSVFAKIGRAAVPLMGVQFFIINQIFPRITGHAVTDSPLIQRLLCVLFIVLTGLLIKYINNREPRTDIFIAKRKMKKKDLIFLLAPAVFFSSVLCFFGPIQSYLTNIKESWSSFTDILWLSLLAWFVLAFLLFALGLLLHRSEKKFKVYCLLLFGLGVALYVQGNFVPFSYSFLNEAKADLRAYISNIIINIVLWTEIIAAPFFLMVVLRDKAKQRVAVLSGCLILLQLIAGTTQLLTTNFSGSSTNESYLSDKGIYELSKNKNVVVFVLDSYSHEYFEDINSDHPEKTDFLDGFTYYPNMVCSYPEAKGAIPFMLTEKYYENHEPYSQYISHAWEDAADYYETLKDNGYIINIYTSLTEGISEEAKSRWIENSTHDNAIVTSSLTLERDMLQLTLMRYLPNAVKRIVWPRDSLFTEMKSGTTAGYPLYSWENTVFYSGLRDKRLTLREENHYQVIHLSGTHLPFSDYEDLQERSGETSAEQEALGCLTILREYIQQMQELGVYDNSLIIITGDIGYNTARSNPIMIVKGYDERHPLVWDKSPVSHANLFATVMSALGLNEEHKFGIPVNETIESNDPRRYMFYSLSDGWEDKEYYPDIVEYHVLPGGNSDEYYVPTGRTYTPTGIIEEEAYAYEIGTPIDFGDTNSTAYFINGIAAYSDMYKDQDNEMKHFNWSVGFENDACFNTGKVNQDLYCNIKLFNWMPKEAQHVIISSNSTVLFDGITTVEMPYISFVIPKDCVVDGKINLHFEYPDATQPSSLSSESTDDRFIAIAFERIIINYISETREIDFSSRGNSWKYLLSGWHSQEDAWRWSDEKATLQAIIPAEGDQQLWVTYWTHPGAIDTAVYYNGNYVGTLPHHQDGNVVSESITLPAEFKSDKALQEIAFVTEGATSSKAFYGGDEPDTRVLGIAVSDIEITEKLNAAGIDLSTNGNSDSRIVDGWYDQEEVWRWTSETAKVNVPFNSNEDAMISIKYWTHPGAKDTQVYLNDQYVGKLPHHTNDMRVAAVVLPISDTLLKESGEQIVTFKTEGAMTSKDYFGGDETDTRVLGIAVSQIVLSDLVETSGIRFYAHGNSDGYLLDGWHDQEAAWRWSNERASIQAIISSDDDRELSISYWTHPGANDTSVYYNGNLIGMLPHHQDGNRTPVTLTLPAEFRAEGVQQTIEFVTDGATTSKDFYGGDEPDTRVLGIAVSEITFH